MNRATLKSLTHAACFVLAFGIAALIGGSVTNAKNSESAAKKSQAPRSGNLPDRPDRPGRAGPTKSSLRDPSEPSYKSKDYQAAWDAIAFRSVTVQERVQLQKAVLGEWAKIDLEGALKAALDSPWDGDHDGASLENLASAFHQAFAQRPLEAWDLLQSGRLGLGASIFKERWAYAAVGKDPMFVLSVANDLPGSIRGYTLTIVAQLVKRDPTMSGEFFTKLSSMPQNSEYSTMMGEVIKVLGVTGSPTEIGLKLADAKTEQERTRFIHEFGYSLRDADAATLKSEWEKLPANQQARAARSLLHHADSSKNIPELMDLFVQMNDWKTLNEQTDKLKQYASGTGKSVDIVNWAMKLPERPETTNLFHRAVEPYIQADPVAAKEWIQTLPANDWRRDRALAEYSQQNLWKIRNEAESRWALDQISNPALKAEASKWRGDWAKQTGGNP